MPKLGRTLIRFAGAILLGASATSIDDPGFLFAPESHTRLETAPVVVAQRDLVKGALIDRTAVSVARWPVGTVPDGAYASIDSVAGRATGIAVFKGEALVPSRLLRGIESSIS